MMRWLAFIASAFIAGVGGGLWAHFITSFSPYSFYLTETFVVLAMLVIGGPYSVSGAVVGTLVGDRRTRSPARHRKPGQHPADLSRRVSSVSPKWSWRSC